MSLCLRWSCNNNNNMLKGFKTTAKSISLSNDMNAGAGLLQFRDGTSSVRTRWDVTIRCVRYSLFAFEVHNIIVNVTWYKLKKKTNDIYNMCYMPHTKEICFQLTFCTYSYIGRYLTYFCLYFFSRCSLANDQNINIVCWYWLVFFDISWLI